MKNNNVLKKSVFIAALLIIFIFCVWFVGNSIQTPDKSNRFGSQSVEVGKTQNDKIEAISVSDDSSQNIQRNTINSNKESNQDKQLQPQNNSGEQQKNQIQNFKTDQSQQNINIKTCTISIHSPEKNILETVMLEINEGDTVYEVLKNITREKGIQMEVTGLASNIYVKGIDNLYEFDKGPLSGWLYSVNKEFPQKSCGLYKLNGGEEIKWHYSLEMGQDIKD